MAIRAPDGANNFEGSAFGGNLNGPKIKKTSQKSQQLTGKKQDDDKRHTLISKLLF